MQIVWSEAFSRDFKRLIRRNPQLRDPVEKTLERPSANSFDPSLKTHKLKGEYLGRWSCSLNYSNRIAFRFMKNPDSGENEILLLTLGSHDDLY